MGFGEQTMNRRDFLAATIAALCLGTAAEAKDYADDILRQLRRNGYDVVSVSRTLLGRTRIRATRAGGEREIILNATTGEILRDVWVIGGESGGLWDVDDQEDAADDRARAEEEEREEREEREEEEREEREDDDNSGKDGGGGDDD
jgi:hypothetical protein